MYEDTEEYEGEQNRTHTILLYKRKRHRQKFIIDQWRFLQSWNWKEWKPQFYRVDIFIPFALYCFGPGEYEVRIPLQRNFITVLKFRSGSEDFNTFYVRENHWSRIWDE